MIVEKIKLRNFRNYSSLDVLCSRGINFIVGDNAKGKTNLIEAIYMLSFGKSFKTSSSQEMIKFGALEANIEAELCFEDYRKDLSITFSQKGKRITLNKKPIARLSEINNVINVLSFVPKDANMLKESPRTRRDFLNATISKLDNSYLKNLISYERLLKERNDVLKTTNVNKELLNVLTMQMARYAKEIFISRVKFVKQINDVLENVFKEISLREESLKIKYLAIIKNVDKYEEEFLKIFDKNLDNDIKRKTTTSGIQREDFELYINDRNLALYGSQGENRMAVIALRLSPYFLVKDEKKKPVVILDDVLSELDKKHEERLFQFLSKFEQVFVTNTKRSEYCKENYYICNENTIMKE